MIGRANVIADSNASFSKADAIIEIYASETAIITVQKDGKNVKVIDFSKDAVLDDRYNDRVYLLAIKEDDYGDYILSSSLSPKPKTVSVIGSDIYQVIAPETMYLFKSGEGAVVELTTENEKNGSISVSDSEITVNYTTTSSYQILCSNTDSIDLSKWDTFCVTGTITKRQTSSSYGGIVFASSSQLKAAGTHTTLGKTAILTGSSEQTTYLDLSSITTETGYVGVVGGIGGTITEMYLER